MQPRKSAMWILSAVVLLVVSSPAQQGLNHSTVSQSQNLSTAHAKARYGKLPLRFESNQGQTDPRVRFVSKGSGYSVFLTSSGMALSLRPSTVRTSRGANTNVPQASKLMFNLVGASQNAQVIGEDPQPGRVNYFIGNDPAKWRTNVPTFSRVRYKDVYPGIDLIYYGNHQQVEFDFAVAPGADPNKIQFQIKGADQLKVNANGDLVLSTKNGDLHFQSPVIYQESNGRRTTLNGKYRVSGSSQVGFTVASHDSSKNLVIDPVLVYSTYLGGSSDDQIADIAVDANGNAYVTGYTESSDFPLADPGSLPPSAWHVFVAKIDPTGSNLIYADYLGGSSFDFGYAIALDSSKNVVITGNTCSANFPTVNPYQSTLTGCFNAFLSKISADGASLLYSTYLGGAGNEQVYGLGVNASDEMYIAGSTSSTDFPVVNAYQATVDPNELAAYGTYGFVTKFSADGSSLVYSTFFGGSSNTGDSPFSQINGLAVDATGNAYVAGTTNTYNFPVTGGAYLATNSTDLGSTIGFVGKFSSSGSLDYSTYFGGSSTNITGIAVDGGNSAYITGTAISDHTLPVTSTSICDPAIYNVNCGTGFVAKLNATGTSLSYSTFLGPFNQATPTSIAVDALGDAFVLAYSTTSSFNPVTPIENYTAANDMLLVEINPTASSQLFATYFGGNGDETSAALTLDGNGAVYVTGYTDASDLPVDPSAMQTANAGGQDSFIAKIDLTSGAAIALSPVSLQFAGQNVSVASSAQPILLRNMGSSQLTISSITASGDFSQTNNCGSHVAGAGSCTINVTFTPTIPGNRAGSIVIQDDAAGSPHTVALSGTANGAIALVSINSLSFTSLVGVQSAAQTVTLTNHGNAALNISSVQASANFGQTSNCVGSLAPSASCQIQVTFTPAAAGAASGSLTINDDATDSPQSVALSGTGNATMVSVSPATLAFGNQTINSTSTARTITVTNTGNTVVTVSAVAASGDFAQTNNCATLAVSATCTVSVTFTPTATGSRVGTLTITDNAQGGSQTVSLSGTGTAAPAPAVTLSSASLIFASTRVASTTTAQTITVTNSGNAVLTVSSVAISGDFAQTNNCSTLAAGASCSIQMTFTPTAVGTRTGTLTITDNAQGGSQTVSLSGTGTAASAPAITLSPTSLTFASTRVTSTTAAQTITVTNSGDASLTVSGVTVSGDFAQTNTCSTVAAGASCLIQVTFTPTAVGTRTGTVTITDSAAGSPHTVALNGTGADFTVTATNATATVAAGATASYNLTVASQGGSFSNAVALSCSGAPALTTCTVSPSSVTPNAGSTAVTVTITTTAATAELQMPQRQQSPMYANLWTLSQGMGVFGMLLFKRRNNRKMWMRLAALALVLMALFLMAGCAGGTGTGPGRGGNPGTQPGTYSIVVTGTSGSVHHNVSLTRTVQ